MGDLLIKLGTSMISFAIVAIVFFIFPDLYWSIWHRLNADD